MTVFSEHEQLKQLLSNEDTVNQEMALHILKGIGIDNSDSELFSLMTDNFEKLALCLEYEWLDELCTTPQALLNVLAVVDKFVQRHCGALDPEILFESLRAVPFIQLVNRLKSIEFKSGFNRANPNFVPYYLSNKWEKYYAQEYKLDFSGFEISNPEQLNFLFQFKQTKDLLFYNCGLEAIPESLTLLPDLEHLNLGKNPAITEFSMLERLVGLKMIDLSYLELSAFPFELDALTKLQQLILNNNRLTVLAEDLQQWPNLTAINAKRNQLIALPESIGKLSNLQRLLLDNNQIESLPNSIFDLKNLKILDLRRNPIITLYPEQLKELKLAIPNLNILT